MSPRHWHKHFLNRYPHYVPHRTHLEVSKTTLHPHNNPKSQLNSIICRKYATFALPRRDARVAEEARLESVCTPKAYRGFESLSLRKVRKKRRQVYLNAVFYFAPCIAPPQAGRDVRALRANPSTPLLFVNKMSHTSLIKLPFLNYF